MTAVKWRLLLVDDDEMIVELLTLRLSAQGYDVQTACDGEKAYVQAKAFLPHVIVCDVVMPKVDGPTFCRRMRAEHNDVPFLFLTAKGQPRDKVEVLSAGGDDYLTKPSSGAATLITPRSSTWERAGPQTYWGLGVRGQVSREQILLNHVFAAPIRIASSIFTADEM